MTPFKAPLKIIGVNPYVDVPEDVLGRIFEEAGKEKGPIPIKGMINGKPYKQTLVKYAGQWCLYVNLIMLKNSPKRIGEVVEISAEFDSEPREIIPPAAFVEALQSNPQAQANFDALIPSRKLEIVRYLANLKTPESLARNIERAIGNLTGENRFVGRDGIK